MVSSGRRGWAVDPSRGVQAGEDGRAVARLLVASVMDPDDGERWLERHAGDPTGLVTNEACEVARQAIGDSERSADRVTPLDVAGPAGGGASVGRTAAGNLRGGRRLALTPVRARPGQCPGGR